MEKNNENYDGVEKKKERKKKTKTKTKRDIFFKNKIFIIRTNHLYNLTLLKPNIFRTLYYKNLTPLDPNLKPLEPNTFRT